MTFAALLAAFLAAETLADLARAAEPALKKHCLACHGPRRPKGGLSLQGFDASLPKNLAMAKNALEQIRSDLMPPSAKPRPMPEEKRALERWLQRALDDADPRKRGPDAGPTPPRRLSREEYDHTLRDLLGVDLKLSQKFPPDGGGGAGFDNNAATLYNPPILLEKNQDAARAAAGKADADKIVLARPGNGTAPRAAAERNLRQFLPRCYRRPVEDADLAPLLKVFDKAFAKQPDYETALRASVAAALAAPSFLFRIDRPMPNDPSRVDDHALACRLSYFLWRSMPDDELLAHAAANRLHEPATLAVQARRLLRDPRAAAFADSFADQWLNLRMLHGQHRPEPGKFPQWTDALRDSLVAEVRLLVRHALTGDGQLSDLIDADYAFLDEAAAKHYGVPNVQGPERRRVRLPDRRRGGVMTAGATLALASYPQRTSPVLRGKFLLEEILGAAPPPPPPSVAVLPPDDRPKDGKTFRQRLEEHRKKAECAGCHARIDPLGFALENYDPAGQWRDKLFDQPIDASGTLVSGEKVDGPIALKDALRGKLPEFRRHLAGKLLSFALGRGLEYSDEPFVAAVAEAAAKSGRGDALALAVVDSYPFQRRRVPGKGP